MDTNTDRDFHVRHIFEFNFFLRSTLFFFNFFTSLSIIKMAFVVSFAYDLLVLTLIGYPTILIRLHNSTEKLGLCTYKLYTPGVVINCEHFSHKASAYNGCTTYPCCGYSPVYFWIIDRHIGDRVLQQCAKHVLLLQILNTGYNVSAVTEFRL